MARDLNSPTLLETALRQALKCDVTHCQTIPVNETMDGKTIWKGSVETFNLIDHPEAKKCYAWQHYEENKAPRFVAVLEKRYVNSPELAVKSAIFFDVEPVQCRDGGYSLDQRAER